jgi:uncharacterized protein (UPF0264 family)
MTRSGPVDPGAIGTGLLASVATLAEVELAVAGGVDLVDLKDPAQGALGAWPEADLRAAVRLVAGRRPVSATAGDLPPEAAALGAAARAVAATGVDMVKLGFFPGADHRALAQALRPVAAEGIRLVAVLMADRAPDLALAGTLAAAGFHGVMLDTADKTGGGLLDHQAAPDLAAFVADARAHGLLSGLAGSLRRVDVATLRPLAPDFMGFRGALCRHGRASTLDAVLLAQLRQDLDGWHLNHEGNACHGHGAANIVRVRGARAPAGRRE